MKKIILGTLAAFALNAAGLAYAAEGDKPAEAAADAKPAKGKKGKKGEAKKDEGKKDEAKKDEAKKDAK
jgi:hypothetical protein